MILRWLTVITWLSLCTMLALASSDAVTPSYTKLVDLLSASHNHTVLLAAFQRARLVPTLNQLNGSTLFAPTNDAIERASAVGGAQAGAVWAYAVTGQVTGHDTHDNLQLALRDTLLYHLLNYTIAEDLTSNRTLCAGSNDRRGHFDLSETLYHPSLSPFNKSYPAPPSLPGSPRDKEPTHPDEPRRVEGLLRGQGQKLRWFLVNPDDDDEETNDVAQRGHGHGHGRNDTRPIPHSKMLLRVGTDWRGDGGATGRAADMQQASNGILLPIDSVLAKPVDIATHIRTNPSLSTFASVLPAELLEYIGTAAHLTVFAPTNDAWDTLSDLEMRYLRSGFADDDLAQIFGQASSRTGAGGGRVGYLAHLLGERLNGTAQITTVWNSSLEVKPNDVEAADGPARVNNTAILEPDILAMNGVIHTVPSLLLPNGSLSLTAEKYLIALNATKFVALLRSVNLSHYVQVPSGTAGFGLAPETGLDGEGIRVAAKDQLAFQDETDDDEKQPHGEERYTILAPTDAVLAAHWPFSSSPLFDSSSLSSSSSSAPQSLSLPDPGTPALRALLSYHIVQGRWTPDELEDGMLVKTVLSNDEELSGHSQRLAVSVQREGGDGEGDEDSVAGGLFGRWWRTGRNLRTDGKDRNGRKRQGGVVGFGGASVIAEPVIVGNSIIYLLSSVLTPPSSPIAEAVSDLRLSTFVASVYAAEMDKELARQPAVTLFVPSNDAFASLGLVMSYLLLPVARDELRSMIRYHAIDGIWYMNEFKKATTAYPTLDGGSEIYVQRTVNNTVHVHGPTVAAADLTTSSQSSQGTQSRPGAESSLNGESRDARVIQGDLLTSTGVIHVVDQVELPPELDVTIVKLLQGAKAATMVDLIRAANLSWVLDAERQQYDGDGDDDDADDGESRARVQAFTILCPTDKALSRLNLTHYLSNPPLLSALVKLHIIPTDVMPPTLQSSTRPRPNGDSPSKSKPPSSPDSPTSGSESDARLPLSLQDEIAYPSLLDQSQSGGTSKYGTLAFRRWGDEGWLVGIKSARGTGGVSDSARVVAFGRASPVYVRRRRRGARSVVDDDDDDGGEMELRAGGGVLLVDAVLVPYYPGWFRRWWIVIVSVFALIVVCVGLGYVGLKVWRRRRGAALHGAGPGGGGGQNNYEPVPDNEEDA